MHQIPLRKIKPTITEPVLAEHFSIRKIEQLLSGTDLVQPLHRHDFFFLLAIKKGTGEHVIDFADYKISDHSVFFMRPGQVHQLTLKAGSSGYLIQFKSDLFSPRGKIPGELLQKLSKKSYSKIDPYQFERISDTLHDIEVEYEDKKERYTEAILAILELLFIQLEREWDSEPINANLHQHYMQDRLDRFLHLLETNATMIKQAAAYAKMMHLTSYQLNAVTKSQLGKSASEVINEHLLLEIKRHLLATNKQVNEIAFILGYDDVSYFIRFFKKHTGYSPEAFRKNFK